MTHLEEKRPCAPHAALTQCSLKMVDPEVDSIIQREQKRQAECIELIASENFTSIAVLECLGSCLTNKYSEGYPGARYYGGTEIIDELECLCQTRALKAFHLDPNEWAVNVQPYSGSPANMAVYVGMLQPHDRIMGLDLPSGGHLTHGFYTRKKKVSATSIFFESLAYKVNPETGLIDYDELRKLALAFCPKLIIAGVSAYPRNLDYSIFRSICDEVGALLFADMAHISGIVAAERGTNPFEHCDIVSTTSHKTLRGPRAAMIFCNIKRNPNSITQINSAVFPSLQGGPHNNAIAGLACQLKEVASPLWVEYIDQVLKNAKALAAFLTKLGYRVMTGGTDNHIVLVDLRPKNVTGAKMQYVCDAVNITLNKNAIAGDPSAMNPSGVRLGTSAMTSRSFDVQDFEKVGQFLHEAVQICQEITKTSGTLLKDFKPAVLKSESVKQLKNDVIKWVSKFPMPGTKIEMWNDM